MKARIINGELQTALPMAGQLQDGTWVSNYHLLPEATLKAEGWKDVEEIKPDVAEGQVLVLNSFKEQSKKIVVTYVAQDDGEKAKKDKRKADYAALKNDSERVAFMAQSLGFTDEEDKKEKK